MLTRKTVILAKAESSYGVDPTPTPSANALMVEDVSLKIEGEEVKRSFLKASLSQPQFIRGLKYADLTFSTELKGTGVKGQLPSWGWEGVLARACGLSETVKAGTSIVWQPVSTGFESCTIYLYMDGIFHKILGCRGSVRLTFEVGRYIKAQWNMRGLFVAPTDASPSAQTFSSVNPVPLLAANFTVGSYSSVCEKVELDLNNSLSVVKDINAATGIRRVDITGRNPSGSFEPDAVLETTHAFWGNWNSATAIALNIGPVGSSAGNIITIAAPKLQYRDIGYGDQDGTLKYSVQFALAMSSGDDELTITFT